MLTVMVCCFLVFGVQKGDENVLNSSRRRWVSFIFLEIVSQFLLFTTKYKKVLSYKIGIWFIRFHKCCAVLKNAESFFYLSAKITKKKAFHIFLTSPKRKKIRKMNQNVVSFQSYSSKCSECSCGHQTHR